MVSFAQMRRGEQVWFCFFFFEARKMGSVLDLLEISPEHSQCGAGK